MSDWLIEKYLEQIDGLNTQVKFLKEGYDGAIGELQAVIDTGLLSSAEHEDLEADICTRISAYWKRS